MTDPFGDLDESAEQEADSRDENTDTEPNTTMPETTTEPDPEPLESNGVDEPAFPFDEAAQEHFYPREQSYEAFEDFVDFEVKRDLREEGVKNVSGREVHDALIQLAMENREEFVEILLDARRQR